MLDRIRRRIPHILRVPPEPQLPEGSPESVLVFRAGRNFYRWRVLGWAVSHLGIVAGVIVAYYLTWRFVALGPAWVRLLYTAAEILGLITVCVALPFTFLALKWDYQLRWYIITDRSLRIRSGIWNVDELTMTFANIQEVRVTSGPVQNLLGLTDVQVHSAGGGAAAGDGVKRNAHVASFEGVDNGAAIRDLIVERLRVFHESVQGSGHPDGTLTALAAVLEETIQLRKSWPGTNCHETAR